MKTIADHIKAFIENDNTLSGPGGMFTGEDFLILNKVLSGTADNFCVFNNGGGRPFHVWMFDVMKARNPKSTLDGFKEFVESQKGYMYMYKIDGVETIQSELPCYKVKDRFQEVVDILTR